MEVVKIKIPKKTLEILVDSDAITTNDFEVIAVDDNGFVYKNNEAWRYQKNICDKEYKKLKDIEFKIRFK